MDIYRDRTGKTLADYPRPSVAVDTAVLTVTGRQVEVLVIGTEADSGTPGEWRLPGGFLREGETLNRAVLRTLREKANVDGLRPRQLHVFDSPTRDDRGWVLSVAHADVVRADRVSISSRVRFFAVDDLPPLQYDHDEIVAFAAEALREDYGRDPDPAGLLEGSFTMRQLRHVHEAVLGERILPDSFRRRMLPQLEATGEFWSEGRGRPAELYTRR